jgi:hypothetical protein
MKKLTLLLLSFPAFVFSQVGIGTNTPNSSSVLDVTATNKGFLPPRIALTGTNDVSTITSPANGLMVYNTATTGTSPTNVIPGFYYFESGKWQRVINQQPDATVNFNTSNPTTGSPTFTPNTPASSNYIYVSSIDNSQWTWNGTTYVTYTPPASTPWNLAGSSNDAGSNKTAAIARSGKIGIGNNNPNATIDARTNPTSSTDPGAGFLGLGTTSNAASTAGAGAMRYSTSSGGVVEYSNGTNWNTLTSTVQRANVYASRLSATEFDINNNTLSNEFGSFTMNVGSGTSNFNATNGVFTAPRTGLYNVSAGMSFQLLQASSSGVLHFLVIKNGSIEACNQAIPINFPINAVMSANISCSVPLNAGETVQIRYHNWTGSTIRVNLNPSFQGRYYFTVTEN